MLSAFARETKQTLASQRNSEASLLSVKVLCERLLAWCPLFAFGSTWACSAVPGWPLLAPVAGTWCGVVHDVGGRRCDRVVQTCYQGTRRVDLSA